MNENHIEKKLKEIDKKLKNNPHLIEKINNHIFSIEEILGTNIQISVLFIDDFTDHFEEVKNTLFIENEILDDTITLNEFLNFFKGEDGDSKVLFDPVYLKKGLNEIKNVLVTTLDDKLIIVPKNKEDEKK